MVERVSRRQFLGASAGVATLPFSVGSAAAADPCTEYEQASAELDSVQSTVSSLKSERNSLQSDIEQFTQTIQQGRDQSRGSHPYTDAERETAKQIGLDARPGMVYLEMLGTDAVTGGNTVTTATAWFVENNLLLTNSHNVEDVKSGDDLRFWTIGGEKHNFSVVDRVASKSPDVALIRTDAQAPKVLQTGSAESLSEGDKLLQIGNPGGFGKWVLTLGELKTKAPGELTSSVPGLQGVSGSPLLDMNGKVVGMTFGGSPVGEGYKPGDRPKPSSTRVRTNPLAAESNALHVPIEDALAKKEEWT